MRMAPLELENDVDVLRTCAILYRDELKRAMAENARLKEEQSKDSQDFLNEDLKSRLMRLEARFFGFGREELGPKRPRPVGHEQQELKLHNRRPHTEKEAEKSGVGDAAVLERIQHDFSPRELERETQAREIAAPASDTAAPWEKIKGMDQESYEIMIVERTYKKVMHQRARYRLKPEYNKTGKEVIITAPGPAKLKAGCQYSIDFAIAVVTDKYESHLPLERQRRRMSAAGLEVDVKTLYTLVEAVAEHCEKGVLAKIRRDIFADFCASHLDESRWPILKARHLGQMWVLSNRIGSIYRFEPTRAGAVAEELVEGYRGAVVTDGFSGYDRFRRVPGIRRALCWAHARRGFKDCERGYPKESAEFGEMVGALYAVEDRAKSFEDLRRLRATESRAVVNKMHAWLWETKSRFLSAEGLSKAIDYCLNFWPELTLFLSDLSVPLDNNTAERAERHAVMGRKNFGGSSTINGADVAATLYSVIESCKKVGLDPREYMKYVITERWHEREPKSPLEISLERFGRNTDVVYPEKDQWQV